MLPLLHPGDKVFADESAQGRSNLHDGDVVVMRHNDVAVMKRILALPGETIGGDDRKVFRNGHLLDEPYLQPVNKEDMPEFVTFATRTIPAAELFVMGDYRDRSLDSRAAEYGPIKIADVVGKYAWTYWHASPTAKSK
jgi:signal peptidase I